MKRQIVKLVHYGIYKVIHDDAQIINPYKVYCIKNGHQKKIAEFANLESAMLELTSIVRQ